jgi:microcin C transport system substrate-binding protein
MRDHRTACACTGERPRPRRRADRGRAGAIPSSRTGRIASYALLWLALVVPAALHAEPQAADGAAAAASTAKSVDGLATGTPRHGLSFFGDLAYPADFSHFDWVNPVAPKGGEFRYPIEGTFDSFNPLVDRGTPVVGIASTGALNWLFDRLLEPTADDLTAAYGRLARSVTVAADGTYVEFALRLEARWHDGVPITAQDVAWTFDGIVRDGSVALRTQYRDVARVEVVDAHTVRFHIAPSGIGNRNLLLDLGQIFPLPSHRAATHPVGSAWSQPPVGSGPYRVATVIPGRTVRYERVADYWGRDLPVNRGRFNFDAITYDYFRNAPGMREAIKAGAVDAWVEYESVHWNTAYDVPAIRDGILRRELISLDTPAGIGALPYFFNTRLPRFADPRVREALWLMRDFEWTNRVVYYDFYDRTASWFSDSPIMTEGLPSEGELALLEPWRASLPPRLFTEPFRQAETPTAVDHRRMLVRADALLRDAGWIVRDGVRVNATTGEPFTIEFLWSTLTAQRTTLIYMGLLRRLGLRITGRLVEPSQFLRRLRTHDFEAMVTGYAQAAYPGHELRNMFTSEAAHTQFSRNYAGIQLPVVDSLVESLLQAGNAREYIAAGRALDRVLLWNFYGVPGFIGKGSRYLYWDRFGQPAVSPRYRVPFTDAWWVDAEKDARVASWRRGVGR